jgi:hypothetical protein
MNLHCRPPILLLVAPPATLYSTSPPSHPLIPVAI